ncbi:calcium/sodium antiporter [Myxococcota bacterium]|nr:calcium/sodium antiporter [Myxococcota bacterium]
MLPDLLILSIGLVLLLGGGEVMVRGATNLTSVLGVSPFVIGLTVVAFGTSAPELAVNVNAALTGRGAISFGNIIGSNMANIGLILGCTALIRPISIERSFATREMPLMLLATLTAVFMGFDAMLGRGTVDVYGRGEGAVLLLMFAGFLYVTVGDLVKRGGESVDRDEAGAARAQLWLSSAMLLGGLFGLVLGAHLCVNSSASLARAMGVPEVIIGLTVLAVGTSLPELVVSVLATLRGQFEIAVGNVVGSNIFNLLLVLGLTNLLSPTRVPASGHRDLIVVTLMSLLLIFVSTTGRRVIIRAEALLLLSVYVGYLTWRTFLAAPPA